MKDLDTFLLALGVGLLAGGLAVALSPQPVPDNPEPKPWSGGGQVPMLRQTQLPPATTVDGFVAQGGEITKCPPACAVAGGLLIS